MMRRSRIDVANDNNEMLVSEARRPQEAVRSRKKRKTVLESFQFMTLKPENGESSDDGNSSCATGGSRNASHLRVQHDDDTVSSRNSDEFLSDQEKVHRAMMYQLATGKTRGEKRSNTVLERLEQMIRDSRLRATTATDDLHLVLGKRYEDSDMNINVAPPLKRSASLPRNFEGPVAPLERIEFKLDL